MQPCTLTCLTIRGNLSHVIAYYPSQSFIAKPTHGKRRACIRDFPCIRHAPQQFPCSNSLQSGLNCVIAFSSNSNITTSSARIGTWRLVSDQFGQGPSTLPNVEKAQNHTCSTCIARENLNIQNWLSSSSFGFSFFIFACGCIHGRAYRLVIVIESEWLD